MSVDYVLRFPKTKKGNDLIFVVIDIFSKMVHFIPCFKRDTWFLGNFRGNFRENLRTELTFRSTYHPQMDGQIELVNRNMGNILRSLVGDHPKQWNWFLIQAKFSYNNSPNISIGQSPFQIMYGMHLRGVHELRNLGRVEQRSATSEDFFIVMQEIHERVKQ